MPSTLRIYNSVGLLLP